MIKFRILRWGAQVLNSSSVLWRLRVNWCIAVGARAPAVEGVKKSRLRRLLCGRAQPFRTSGARLNSFWVQPLAGKPEAFRTVPVGLWADPVVTRNFHVASRRINNLRELSGEQAAEPQDPATSDFFTLSLAWAGIGRSFGARKCRNSSVRLRLTSNEVT